MLDLMVPPNGLAMLYNTYELCVLTSMTQQSLTINVHDMYVNVKQYI